MDMARAWIDYVTTAEVNYQWCINHGFLSPIIETASLLGPDDAIMTAGSRMLAGAIISGVPSTAYQDWNAVKLLYHDAFDYVLKNRQVPPDSFLRDLDTKRQALKL